MRIFALFRAVVLSVLAIAADGAAHANDSVAEMKAGGIVLARTGFIQIDREDLYISRERISVAYRFRNITKEPVETIVAFPMPDMTGSPFDAIALPGEADDNFLDFTVTVDGKAIAPELQQRAWAGGIDVTDTVLAAGLPLVPDYRTVAPVANRLSDAVKADLVSRGILYVDQYDDGSGMQEHMAPTWTLKSAYWWRMRFEPNIPVVVEHDYKPSVGGTAGVSFINPDGSPGYGAGHYARTYCTDEPFLSAVKRRLAEAARSGDYGWSEQRVAYVLSTGANWAGPIGTFHLTVDKTSTGDLVSFCGQGIEKTGPTTFETTYHDFNPEGDLEVLFVKNFR